MSEENNAPAFVRNNIKLHEPVKLKSKYAGHCQCGGILNEWIDSGDLFCHSCPTPVKYFNHNKTEHGKEKTGPKEVCPPKIRRD